MNQKAIKTVLVAGVLLCAVVAQPVRAVDGFLTSIQPYVVPVGGDYQITPLLSVGDIVPETSHPLLQYRMVGIPDGLGVHGNADGTVTVYMNHELIQANLSQPVVDGVLNRGALVSRYILSEDGSVLSGERAYDVVYAENTLVGSAAEAGNITPGFGRFCSGNLAGKELGFDRPIYFANEEGDAGSTFDLRGGQTIAIFDNEAHALPKLGFFAKENSLAMSFPGNLTVIMSLEDGPATPDSQLYLYVGKKDRRPGASALRRNGLDNGKLYVFASTAPGMNDEVAFQSGTIGGKWVEIPNAELLTAAQLETAADAAGAFGFVRVEDGAFSKTDRKDFYFVTTGTGAPGSNVLGRLYHLELNPGNPTKPATLTVIYNADQIIAAGGDTAISPDNIDVSEDYLMINEDGTTQSRAVMASKGRDGSVWRFKIGWNGNIEAGSATRVASLDPPGRDGVAVGPGVWETSGIIDTSELFGDDTWLQVVQAHSPTAAPAPNTVEDGQLVLMTPADDDHDHDHDHDHGDHGWNHNR